MIACISAHDLACLKCFGRRRLPVLPMEILRVQTAIAYMQSSTKRKYIEDHDFIISDHEYDSDAIIAIPMSKKRKPNISCSCCADKWFPSREEWFDMHIRRWTPVWSTTGTNRFNQIDHSIETAIRLRTGLHTQTMVAPWTDNLDQYNASVDGTYTLHRSVIHGIEDLRIVDGLTYGIDVYCTMLLHVIPSHTGGPHVSRQTQAGKSENSQQTIL